MNKQNQLEQYGRTQMGALLPELTPGTILGRVTNQSRTLYTVMTAAGTMRAQVTGKLTNMAVGPEDFPTVGDWVVLKQPAQTDDAGVIEQLVPRKSVFARKSAGRSTTMQLVAANIDTLFLCMAMDANFNVRRLERYLAVARDSGAAACVVLTKADLSLDFAEQMATVAAVAGDAPVIVCDATRTEGWQELAALVQPGATYAFLGSSGVGKTTLINRLLGRDELDTGGVRLADAHGRHTTTSRQLVLLTNGGIVIDTPGMRELGILDADIDGTFSDIQELAVQCRFNDCTHTREPGCAVQAALTAGTLDQVRFDSYNQLRTEQAVNTELRGKAREHAKMERMFGSRKNLQAAMRNGKNKRR